MHTPVFASETVCRHELTFLSLAMHGYVDGREWVHHTVDALIRTHQLAKRIRG